MMCFFYAKKEDFMKEEIVKLNVSDISDFPKHPFKINNDLNYEELKESIKENGILVPAIVRQKEDGNYEMISGHRRKKICEENGIEQIPCIIKNISDDEAVIMMVDSNLQRDKILPSEKAQAYKMKLDALNHQGKTLSPLGTKSSSVDEINDSKSQIYRYVRLTYLIPELLQLVDDTVLKDKRAVLTMGIRPAVELSYLTKDQQEMVYEEISYEDLTPSHVQAKRIRTLAENNELDSDKLESIFLEPKPNQQKRISFNEERIRKVLPKDLKDYKIEDFIIKAIENYSKTLALERGDSNDLEI
ncbi:MAG: ParB/RepB/Spo0J family partition protein [Bacilli bacterium]|nr:ParB/RepB/Spo0J family partition protein [Bacilli bacterium]